MNSSALLSVTLADIFHKKHPVGSNKDHIMSALQWLKRAQDITGDNGVSAWYSLLTGWRPSYIETTGYIINTFFACADAFDDRELFNRAVLMADFLVRMQLKNGAYRTHTPTHKRISKPTVFDTGQDLIGMVEAYKRTKKRKYLTSAVRATNFLCSIQEPDGSWKRYSFENKTHTYHTRVAWGLLEVYTVTHSEKYKKAAVRALEWAKGNQLTNGWFTHNELIGSLTLTHTISYAAEGFLWSGLLLKNKSYIAVAAKAVEPLAAYFLKHSFMPASFTAEWKSTDRYECLTGNAQLSLVWGALYAQTKNNMYYKAMRKMNKGLKQTQDQFTSQLDIRGGIKGSQPIYGELFTNKGYCRMAYPNWAAKFFIDALLMEEKLRKKK